MKNILTVTVLLMAVSVMCGCISKPSWYGAWYGWPQEIALYDEHTNQYRALEFRITQHPVVISEEAYDDVVLSHTNHPILVDGQKRCIPVTRFGTDFQVMVRGVIGSRFIRNFGGTKEVDRNIFTNFANEQLVIELDN